MHKLFNSRDVKILLKLVKFKVCIMYMHIMYYHTLRDVDRKIKYCQYIIVV